MANNGWFKMYRGFQDWEYYKNNNVKVLWLHILLNTEYNGAEKGTYRTKIDDLSTALNMTREQIKHSLTLLEKSNQIKYQNSDYEKISLENSFPKSIFKAEVITTVSLCHRTNPTNPKTVMEHITSFTAHRN